MHPHFVAKEHTDKQAEAIVQESPDKHILLTFPTDSLTFFCSMGTSSLLKELTTVASHSLVFVSSCQYLSFKKTPNKQEVNSLIVSHHN